MDEITLSTSPTWKEYPSDDLDADTWAQQPIAAVHVMVKLHYISNVRIELFSKSENDIQLVEYQPVQFRCRVDGHGPENARLEYRWSLINDVSNALRIQSRSSHQEVRQLVESQPTLSNSSASVSDLEEPSEVELATNNGLPFILELLPTRAMHNRLLCCTAYSHLSRADDKRDFRFPKSDMQQLSLVSRIATRELNILCKLDFLFGVRA
ncbi:unnamed protein product [Calicophoron daubneyi]|uniref:Uncharacterized protein n=1 Tax=Calicophoron daubneyi TaxID=300641 RepID=A0AAV2TTU1_CALDB